MNRRVVAFTAIAVVVIAVGAVVMSSIASSQPDGLEYVAEREGFADTAGDHSFDDSPFADYGGDDAGITALSAVLGVVLCVGLGAGLFIVISKTARTPKNPDPQT